MPTSRTLHEIRNLPSTEAQEQVGGAVIRKLRDYRLRLKREAQREVLNTLFDHYKQQPYEVTSHGDVAAHLLEVLAELNESEGSL